MNIKRINADLETAKKLIDSKGNPTNDEYLYDIAAYHTQQAVEKSLKYFLHDVYGEDNTSKQYKTHNISSLLLMVSKYDDNFLKENSELVELSDEITNWEASSRYGESLVATREKIMKALKCADKLWLKILEIEKEKTNLNNKTNHIVRRL